MKKNNIDPIQGDYPQEETMSKKELEQYFTAIKDDFNHIDERFDGVDSRLDRLENRLGSLESRMEQGFNRLESICFAILELTRGYDAKFKNFEGRIINLEKRTV